MIKNIFLVAAIFACMSASAQLVGRDQLGNGFILTKEKNLEVQGSPYLNEEFTRGQIIMDGKDPMGVYLRYNVLDEVMEVKADLNNPEMYSFNSNLGVEYRIGDKTYTRETMVLDGKRVTGYYENLFSGEQLKLVKKAIGDMSEPVAATSSYETDKPGRISIDEEYYVVFPDETTEEVEMKERKLRRTFDSKEAKAYLKEHKIKTEKNLVDFIKFADQI